MEGQRVKVLGLSLTNNEAEGKMGWPNTAARLAGWRRMIQQGVICYVMDGHAACPDGPHHLPWSGGCSITKCTQNTVMSHVTQGLGRHGLVLY
jgi:hypothetical protein